LELGFGTGHALVALAAAVGSTGRVCGLDISSGMLRVARDRVGRAGSRNVVLTLGDARRLCFREATFECGFYELHARVVRGGGDPERSGGNTQSSAPGWASECGRDGHQFEHERDGRDLPVAASAFPALCRLPADRRSRCARGCPISYRTGGRHVDVGLPVAVAVSVNTVTE
jgi:SAM-dependent methyltransferase